MAAAAQRVAFGMVFPQEEHMSRSYKPHSDPKKRYLLAEQKARSLDL